MIRLVLAAAIATALFAVTIPALDAARSDVTETRLATQADRLERAVGELVSESTAVESGDLAARRTLTISVPGRTPSTARADVFAIGCPRAVLTGQASDPDCDAALITRIAGEMPVIRDVHSADLVVPNGPIRLGPGEHRIALRYVDHDGRPIVHVTRS